MSVKAERIKAIVTIIVIAVVNIINIYGYAVDADEVVNVITSILSAITIVYAWWKNQNITEEAIAAQGTLNNLKKSKEN